ncbi:hypothetical protein MMC12_005067 [Toensbergia leucococca]|nr:hypothetical protein [Toensbergia leucococca]
MHFSTLLICSGLVHLGIAGYTLNPSDDYTTDFFDKFSFWTQGDPTHGYVNYVDNETALSKGYISQQGSQYYMGVDSTNSLDDAAAGRDSVRLTSNSVYDHALVILDLAHMPSSACGTWPAFWMVGNTGAWPTSGEIDIIEGVNQQSQNDMTLHTTPGCTISQSSAYNSGTSLTTQNCDVNAAGQSTNAGCQLASSDSTTYGTGFNSNGGGIYATEITSDAISIWHFSHSNAPGDINGPTPNPSAWTTQPVAVFSNANCDIDAHFYNMQIVFDITFCGDWAGNVWSSSSCASQNAICKDYVQTTPSAFTATNWLVNSLKVYQDDGSTQKAVAPVSSSSSIAIASTAATPISSSTTSITVATPISVTSSPPVASVPTTPAKTQPAVETETALTDSDFGFGSSGIPERVRRSAKVRRHLGAHKHGMGSW